MPSPHTTKKAKMMSEEEKLREQCAVFYRERYNTLPTAIPPSDFVTAWLASNQSATEQAKPVPALSEDEAVEIMAASMRGTRMPTMSGKHAPDSYDYMARKAYRRLLAAQKGKSHE